MPQQQAIIGFGTFDELTVEEALSSQSSTAYWQVPLVQLAILAPIGGVLWVINRDIAFAFLAGCLTSLVPQLYFTSLVVRWTRIGSASMIAKAFFRAESGKFVLTLVFFAMLFAIYPQIVAWGVFMGYGSAWLLQIAVITRVIT